MGFQKRAFIILLLPFFLLIQNFVGENKEMILSVRGTLVIATATKEGLVICADKRSYDELRGDIDTIDKISKLSPKVTSSSTGNVRFYEVHSSLLTNEKSLKLVYDADDIVKDYFSKKEFKNNEEFWGGLEDVLAEKFKQFLSQTRPEIWPKSAVAPKHILYQIIFSYLVNKNEIRSTLMEFIYKKEPPQLFQIKRT